MVEMEAGQALATCHGEARFAVPAIRTEQIVLVSLARAPGGRSSHGRTNHGLIRTSADRLGWVVLSPGGTYVH
jgi:hypothetical protein